MSQIIRRQAVRQDLVDIVYYFIRNGSPATARRFREQAEFEFNQLAAMPGMGPRYQHEHPALADLRFQPISRFKKYLVFYRPIPGGIEVLRVLHGARDLHSILSEDIGLDEEAEGNDEPDDELLH